MADGRPKRKFNFDKVFRESEESTQITDLSKRYYLIDLNFSEDRFCGLLNQLYALVNGILLGHSVGRDVIVSDFYTTYNQPDTIPLNKIVDIPKLNCSLVELGISCHLLDYHSRSPCDQEVIRRAPKSVHFNPVKYALRGLKLPLDNLKKEQGQIINLGNTMFSDFDDYPAKSDSPFWRIMLNIQFTQVILDGVDHVMEKYDLTDYVGIHFRLEDDMIKKFRIDTQERYRLYQTTLANIAGPDTVVYLSTHLTKSENSLNHLVDDLKKSYPKVVVCKESFPFPRGREIDALIDLLVMSRAKAVIGQTFSAFSKYLLNLFRKERKVAIDIEGTLTSTRFGIINYAQVQYGTVGTNGDLGYEGLKVTLPVEGADAISAHAPSRLILVTNQTVEISGYINPSSMGNPTISFRIDDSEIGTISGAKSRTKGLVLAPGSHLLEAIPTGSANWAHSIWVVIPR